MAKTIKFNLICDGKPIRTIEDLQNHFSIEDVLEYYNNQLLHRWLKVRGYSTELEKVSAITSEKKMDIIKELIAIFNITTDMAKIEEDVYILEYHDERKKALDRYNREQYNVDYIICEYRYRYQQLVDDILFYTCDAAKIKANITIMTEDFTWAMGLFHKDFFWYLWSFQNILGIMCLLMNDISRDYYLPEMTENCSRPLSLIEIIPKQNKEAMYNTICQIIDTWPIKQILGTELKTFSGNTDGDWKVLEPKGKRFMILKMEHGDFIRPLQEIGRDLSWDDIFHKFIILDGIRYKSNDASHELLYMEV